MEDDRPTAAISVDADSRDIDEDDAAPDWRSLAALVQRFNKSNPHFIPSTSGSDAAETAAAGGPAFIPRKGEKDFEPVARTGKASKSKSKGKRAAAQYGVTDALHEDGQEAVSDEEDVEDEGSEDDDEDDAAILEAHQQRQLAESRAALFAALRAGGRRVHSSKMHNSFTWCPPGTLGSDGALSPHAGRAVCDDPKGTVYGIHFTSVGHNEHGKVTLLPEEALYLHERGAIELWRDYGPSENALGAAVDAKRKKVPMSVQQAWAELIGVDGLTLERYNVRSLSALSAPQWHADRLTSSCTVICVSEAPGLHLDPRQDVRRTARRATSQRSGEGRSGSAWAADAALSARAYLRGAHARLERGRLFATRERS